MVHTPWHEDVGPHRVTGEIAIPLLHGVVKKATLQGFGSPEPPSGHSDTQTSGHHCLAKNGDHRGYLHLGCSWVSYSPVASPAISTTQCYQGAKMQFSTLTCGATTFTSTDPVPLRIYQHTVVEEGGMDRRKKSNGNHGNPGQVTHRAMPYMGYRCCLHSAFPKKCPGPIRPLPMRQFSTTALG